MSSSSGPQSSSPVKCRSLRRLSTTIEIDEAFLRYQRKRNIRRADYTAVQWDEFKDRYLLFRERWSLDDEEDEEEEDSNETARPTSTEGKGEAEIMKEINALFFSEDEDEKPTQKPDDEKLTQKPNEKLTRKPDDEILKLTQTPDDDAKLTPKPDESSASALVTTPATNPEVTTKGDEGQAKEVGRRGNMNKTIEEWHVFFGWKDEDENGKPEDEQPKKKQRAS